jgi:hypothetical protein
MDAAKPVASGSMKTKLRQFRRHVAWLLLLKLNPNPLADNLAQFPKTRGFMVEHVQNFGCRKSAIVKSLTEISPMQLVLIRLCGPVLEP